MSAGSSRPGGSARGGGTPPLNQSVRPSGKAQFRCNYARAARIPAALVKWEVCTSTFDIRQAGRADYGVLISCAGDGDSGGGLCLWDGSRLEVIDRLSTAGLCVSGDLFRCLRGAAEADGGELLAYDSRGVRSYFRVDALSDVHYLLWHDGHLIVANTGHNEIAWLALTGEITRRWRAPGENDSWHLNDLLIHNGRLLACAFGRYRYYREYKDGLRAGHGIVFDVESGKDILTGLCAPHSPRYFDGAWAVCNSLHNEVLQIEDSSGSVMRRLQLNHFTRGFAVTDDLLLVGESADRQAFSTGEGAALAVILRNNWTVLSRISVPFREISDVVLVPLDLVAGCRTGFRTNPLRVAEQDQLALFHQAGLSPRSLWAVSGPLERSQMRSDFAVSAPSTMRRGGLSVVECTVTNCGDGFFFSAPPYPVHLSYKWLRPDGSRLPEAEEGTRTPLPGTLAPGASISCRMDVVAPPVCNSLLLRITLVQEHVAWFDEVDAANSWLGMVEVG